MSHPKLTFACELEPGPLQELFAAPSVIDDLLALGAAVSLGILDLSPERAAVVQRLNAAGVPMVAWQLLPKEEGYWFGLDNAPLAAARYAAFKAWTAEHNLHWAGLGVDIETDINDASLLASGRWRELLPQLAGRLLDNERLRRAQMAYAGLLAQMRADGYTIESYHIPFIIDERMAGSTLLQRLFGIVDVPADRDVLMLYSSFLGALGPAVLWSYARDVLAAGVGSTGGGVELGSQLPVLDWSALTRDLLMARRRAQEIFIFSLEGCVRQGFLSRLCELDWNAPVVAPEGLERVNLLRSLMRRGLWASAHPWAVLLGLVLVTRALGSLVGKRPRTRAGHPAA